MNEAIVALSSCEAEYIAASMDVRQSQWITMFLLEMNLKEEEKMEFLIDRKSAIDWAKHPVTYGRSKHNETCFHFLRDQVNKDKMHIKHCKTKVQVADLLTKPLKACCFEYA